MDLKTCFFSWSRSCLLSFFLGQVLVFSFFWSSSCLLSFFFLGRKHVFVNFFLFVSLFSFFFTFLFSFINSRLCRFRNSFFIMVLKYERNQPINRLDRLVENSNKCWFGIFLELIYHYTKLGCWEWRNEGMSFLSIRLRIY